MSYKFSCFLNCFLHLKRETAFYHCQATPLRSLTPSSSPLQKSAEIWPLEVEIPLPTHSPTSPCHTHPQLFAQDLQHRASSVFCSGLFSFSWPAFWGIPRVHPVFLLGCLVAWMVKDLPAAQENRVQPLGQEDPLEKEMATHSSTLAWKIPWTEEPGKLQPMGSQRVRHNFMFTLSKIKYP